MDMAIMSIPTEDRILTISGRETVIMQPTHTAPEGMAAVAVPVHAPVPVQVVDVPAAARKILMKFPVIGTERSNHKQNASGQTDAFFNSRNMLKMK